MHRPATILLLAAAAPLVAQDGTGPFRYEETGRSYARLADAVAAIGDGDGTIAIAPGVYQDCAVQSAGRIAYKAQQAGSVVFNGVACEGKAGLVLRGRAAHVEGLIFQNFRVADRNGSGIRLEKGDLTVRNTIFRASEQGILTHDDPRATLRVDQSTFSQLGGCPDGMCSHSIYAGNYGQVIVTRSRFERGTGGHYVKARSGLVDISQNSFDDSRGSATNYMIDLPAGASGRIARNEFVQGRSKDNYSAFIAVGAEQVSHRSAGLVISANAASLAPGVNRTTSFVADWTGEPIRITANRLGPGLKAFDAR